MKKYSIIFSACLLWVFIVTAQTATITLWKENAICALWNKATSTVAYGKKNIAGYFKIYISDSLGNNEQQISYAGWRTDRHQIAQEWDPSGKYLFVYVEKNEYVKEKGHKRKPDDAIPGYGAYTDLWLMTRDGKQAWPLTNLPNEYSSGIIHGAISEDGKMIAWSERIASPNFFKKGLGAGGYVIKVADFQLDSIPRLTNIRTFQPGDILATNEMESISKDKTMISFYSTFETKSLFNTPIYTLNILTGKITRLTKESFAQAPTFTPDGKKIVYMTGHQCDIFPFEIQGSDWWIMNNDGSDKQRITYMNKKNHPHSVNHYRLAGTLSFISDRSFFGDVMTKPLGLTGNIVKVVF
jgi:Tol biopolymer transport system component